MSIPVEIIDHHLDKVLRASGSGLKFYIMAKTINDMRAAMEAAMLAAPPQGGAAQPTSQSQAAS